MFSSRLVPGMLSLLFLTHGLLAAPQQDSQNEDRSEEPAAKSSLTALIEQLESKSFRTREAATTKLAMLGIDAVPAVQAAATKGSLEAGVRAVEVLRSWFASENVKQSEAAEQALEELTRTGPRSIGRRARDVLDRYYFSVSQTRAVDRIRKLGGQVHYDRERPLAIKGQFVSPPNGFVDQIAIGADWKGGDEELMQVARLKSLRVFYLLNGHKFSRDALDKLQAALPGMEYQTRGAAFLGVASDSDFLGCLIRSVRPGTAADNAGMRESDIVVEIAGKAVRGPQDLIRIIGEHQPGETIRITVLRGAEANRFGHPALMKYVLIEMLSRPEEFSPLLAVGILSNMRRELTVTLDKWKLNN